LDGGGTFIEFEKVGGGGGIYIGAGLSSKGFELVWGDGEHRAMIVELIALTQSSFLDNPLPSMKEYAGFMLEELLLILRYEEPKCREVSTRVMF
jgi:hypothetical protein